MVTLKSLLKSREGAVMCRLCGTEEERQEEKRELLFLAERMEDFAFKLRNLASGALKPHSSEVRGLDISAKSILKSLAEYV